MISPPPRPRSLRSRGAFVAFLLAGLCCLLPLLVGCGGSASAGQEVVLLRLDTPLRDPRWIDKKDFTLALRENRPEVVKLPASAGEPGEGTLSPGAITGSENLRESPQSMAPNPMKADEVYLPEPGLRRVVQMNTLDLRTVRSFAFNETPQWAVVHSGSQTLFTLSRDGSTVSVLGLENPGALGIENPGTPFDFRVNAGAGARIDAPRRGMEPQFWLWGPNGISEYAGFPPERKVNMPINARSFAVDIETAQRAYVGEGDSSRVVAVEGDAAGALGGKLERVAERDLGQTAEYLDTEDIRVFAATRDKLFQMKREDLSVLQATDFRGFLRQRGLGNARVSGMAVTGDRVYLTLRGEPYMLSIQKTDKTRA